MHIAEVFCGWLFVILSVTGTAYTLLAAVALGRFAAQSATTATNYPPVTLLKPLHFDEAGVEADIATFLDQDYPGPVQIVFGVQNASDPAIAVVNRLMAKHRGRDMVLVTDRTAHGSNGKVANLINMAPQAKHDVLIVSDSDIAVPRDYLCRVVSALLEPGVGAVTCPYTGRGGAGIWSRLAAMGTSYDFLPNLAFGTVCGIANACLGSTIALRRQTLATIGGFPAFANYLADDYEIGRAVRHLGQEVRVLPLAVAHRTSEKTAGELFRHELRWVRTTRIVRPLSYLGTVVTFPVPLAMLAVLFSGFSLWALAALILALAARAILWNRVNAVFAARSGPLWLLPLRDVMSFLVFAGSFFSQKVAWRGSRFEVEASGAMSQIEKAA